MWELHAPFVQPLEFPSLRFKTPTSRYFSNSEPSDIAVIFACLYLHAFVSAVAYGFLSGLDKIGLFSLPKALYTRHSGRNLLMLSSACVIAYSASLCAAHILARFLCDPVSAVRGLYWKLISLISCVPLCIFLAVRYVFRSVCSLPRNVWRGLVHASRRSTWTVAGGDQRFNNILVSTIAPSVLVELKSVPGSNGYIPSLHLHGGSGARGNH